MSRRKTYLEKMGLRPEDRLTKKKCKDRVKYLDSMIKKNKYSGLILQRAKYYRNWYGWLAKNGGTRAA